jgi:hypothetical protein
LPRPKECPDEVYKIMESCWDEDPKKRPTFKMLTYSTNEILERANGMGYFRGKKVTK